MISLKDLWQQQRLQRQQEIAQRQQNVALYQQQVRNDLVQLQQERLVKATELHKNLNQSQLDLQQQTQSYLKHISEQRRQQAQALVNSLRHFAEVLQAQTHQFLSLTQANRQLQADELFRNLNQFHINLSTSVVALRTNLQTEIQSLRDEVQTICAETQMYLSSRQQERIREQIQLAESLSAYVQSLQADVSNYLAHLNQLDKERVQELHTQFQHQRQARATEMEELFEDLAIFRGELREYCTNLQTMVWGDGTVEEHTNSGTATQVTSPAVPQVQASPRSSSGVPSGRSPQPAPAKAPPVVTPAPVSASVSTAVMTPPKPASVTALSSPPQPSIEPLSVAAAKPDTSTETLTHSAATEKVNDSSGNEKSTVAISWSNASVVPSRKATSDVELEIFDYLKTSEGARLTEIESALDINRFQVVDALRSLIKQGRVTQRDRVYVIQEEATL